MRELAALRDTTERLKGFKQDAETTLKTYVQLAPNALDTFTPEQCQRLYNVLGLRMIVWPDACTEIDGYSSWAGLPWWARCCRITYFVNWNLRLVHTDSNEGNREVLRRCPQSSSTHCPEGPLIMR